MRQKELVSRRRPCGVTSLFLNVCVRGGGVKIALKATIDIIYMGVQSVSSSFQNVSLLMVIFDHVTTMLCLTPESNFRLKANKVPEQPKLNHEGAPIPACLLLYYKINTCMYSFLIFSL